MLKKSIGCAGSLMLIAALAVGCVAEDGDDSIADAKLLSEQDIIVNYMIEAGYPESEIQVLEDGRVIVGRDAVVTMRAAREMVGHIDDFGSHDGDEEFRNYRTNNVLSPSISRICIIPTAEFNGNAAASSALDLAIDRYNDPTLALNFDMARMNAADGTCDATIAAKLDTSGGGVSGFPEGGLPYPEFYIGSTVASNYGVPVGAHVIEHEIGHTIGFRHTDYYNRSISCGGAQTNEGAADVGAVHIAGTPTTAVLNGSVMNSCYNTGSNGVWTSSDVTALTCLYKDGSCAPPPPPTYNVTVATYSNQSLANKKTAKYGPFSAAQYSAMRFSTTGANGDADLYVRQGNWPTTTTYDCASAGASSNEVCEANPSSGSYYVMVKAYSAYSGLTVKVEGAN